MTETWDEYTATQAYKNELTLYEATISELEQALFGDMQNRSRDELIAKAEDLSEIRYEYRVQLMLSAYARGFTLEEIGLFFGVTREWVRVLMSSKPEYRMAQQDPMRPKTAQIREKQLNYEKHREEITKDLLAGDPPAEVAHRYDVLVSDVYNTSAYTSDQRRIYVHRNRAGRKKTSDADLLDGLKKAAEELGRAPRMSEYDAFARAHNLRGPQTIVNRFGTWRAAMALIGYEAIERAERSDKVVRADAEASLLKAVELCGGIPSSKRYSEVSSQHGLISASTIRKVFGGWTEVNAWLVSQGHGFSRPGNVVDSDDGQADNRNAQGSPSQGERERQEAQDEQSQEAQEVDRQA